MSNINANIVKGLSKGFRQWLQSHDVDANELDKQQVRLYLDFYEQEQHERRALVFQGSLRDSM